MPTIFWRILAPKMTIPVHTNALNLCRTLFNWLESDRHRSMLIMTTFQSTSTSPMMWYSPLLFGISTMVSHVHSVENYPVPNYICIISTTIRHLGRAGFPSVCATTGQIFKCSERIPDGPPYQFLQIRLRDHSISSLARTLSVTSTSSTITVMGLFGLLL